MRKAAIGLACLLFGAGCAPNNPNVGASTTNGSFLSPDDQSVFENVYGDEGATEQELAPRKLGSNKSHYRPPLGTAK